MMLGTSLLLMSAFLPVALLTAYGGAPPMVVAFGAFMIGAQLGARLDRRSSATGHNVRAAIGKRSKSLPRTVSKAQRQTNGKIARVMKRYADLKKTQLTLLSQHHALRTELAGALAADGKNKKGLLREIVRANDKQLGTAEELHDKIEKIEQGIDGD